MQFGFVALTLWVLAASLLVGIGLKFNLTIPLAIGAFMILTTAMVADIQ